MKILILTMFLVSAPLFASIRTDYVELTGKIIKTTKQYVYLRTRKGKKTIAPKSKFSKRQLSSGHEVTVFLSRLEFAKLLAKVKKNKLL